MKRKAQRRGCGIWALGELDYLYVTLKTESDEELFITKKRHPYKSAFSDSFLAEARSSNNDQ